MGAGVRGGGRLARLVANVAIFNAGWFGCALGAGNGYGLAPVGLIGVLLGLHFAFIAGDRRAEVKALAAVAAIGLLVDTALGLTGVMRYQASPFPAWLAPPWLAALWLIFASTLRHSLGWLAGRPLLGIAFGAVGGPAAYLGGSRLGAIVVPDTTAGFLIVMVPVWAVLLPLLLWVAHLPDAGRSASPVGGASPAP